MNADEFKAGLIQLYGDEGWQAKAVAAFGMDAATMRRWWNGHSAKVPGVAAKLLEHLLAAEARRRRQRKYEKVARAKRRSPQ